MDTEHLEGLPTSAGVTAALARLAVDAENRIVSPQAGGPELILLRDASGAERLETLDRIGDVRITKPGRIAQAVNVETVESLSGYVKRFKAEDSLFFASISANSILAVLDYHGSSRDALAPDPDDDATFTPDFAEHRASLCLPFSLEWAAWSEIDGRLMPQLEFVRFLEENREDILTPDAATVLEACRDLQALRKVDFRSVVREDSDNYKIEYAEDAEAKSNREGVKLPSEFLLGLPVYFDDESHEVTALLRWKLDEGQLRLGIKLKRAERIRQAVFKGIVTKLVEETGVAAVYGSIASA